MPDDLCFLSASELAARIVAREVSAAEVAGAHLERIETLNPSLNAVVTLNERARAEAEEADRNFARGEPTGRLHGVPFTIKDSLDTAGLRTTRGSRLFADLVPQEDATAVARLKRAGGILLGKTNLPDFALWWETESSLFGRTANPWNRDRTAGGSSGGEAAAIAAGLSPLGLGSDLGGSIRLPASHCGIVGLKPTHGRVPLTGHWPETILRFMHVGPLARTVEDVALALSLVSGPDGRDWHAVPAPPVPAEIPQGDLSALRVGWAAEPGFGAVEPDVAAVVRGAADALAELGCAVEEVDLSWLEARDCNPLTLTLFGGEGRAYFAPLIAGREADLHPVLRRRLAAPLPPLDDYLEAEAEVEGLRRDLTELFTRVDVLLCPTVPVPAPPHALEELAIGGRTFVPRTLMRATIPFDLTGSPALSVPFGSSAEGLPIGVQVVGARFDEETVLRVGRGLEEGRPGGRRFPLVGPEASKS